MTGYFVRARVSGKWNPVEIDQLSDDDLYSWIAEQCSKGDNGWAHVEALAKWIRDDLPTHINEQVDESLAGKDW